MARHTARDWTSKFCVVPADDPCGDVEGCANYRDVCAPSWAGHTFERLKKGEVAKPKGYEAHHIVCVSPVTDELFDTKDASVSGPVRATEWCINNDVNMMAMPVWGHTVKWYCSFSSIDGVVRAAFKKRPRQPPFKNIPAHDIDHNIAGGYTHEIRTELKNLVAEAKSEGHELKGNSLVGALNDLGRDYKRKLLEERGIRKDGTHNGWKLGAAEPSDPEWLHPFSMAITPRVSTMGFPSRTFDEKLAAWIDRIAKAIAAGA